MKDFSDFSSIHLFTGQAYSVKDARLLAADIFADFPIAVLASTE
jgi:hypothetical protein